MPVSAPGGGAGQRNPLVVNGLVLNYGTLNDVLPRTKGVLLPDEEVDLSFEMSGKITNIQFNEGTFVKQGQLLAKINDKPPPLGIQIARAARADPAGQRPPARRQAGLFEEEGQSVVVFQRLTRLDRLFRSPEGGDIVITLGIAWNFNELH